MRCYPHFILAMRSSRGFASTAPDLTPCSDSLSLRLRARRRLTLPVTVSRRIIMQKARRHAFPYGHSPPTACRHVVSGSLPPLVGVLPIFRSRYWFAIGRQRVLSLAGWSPQIQTHFHVSESYSGTARPLALRLRDFHPLWSAFPDRSARDLES